jgi:hypothetical protein
VRFGRIAFPAQTLVIVLLMFSGCSGGGSTSPPQPTHPTPSPSPSPSVAPSGNLTVKVRVPASQSGIGTVELSDSTLYGAGETQQSLTPAACPLSGTERDCVAVFSAPAGTNQIQVDAYNTGQSPGSATPAASGIFPDNVGNTPTSVSAVLGGSISSLEVIPYNGPTLPLGQGEGVWVVAQDQSGSVIIGTYQPGITLTASSNLTLSVCTSSCYTSPSIRKRRESELLSSVDSEELYAAWTGGYSGQSAGVLTASTSSELSGAASITPTSGFAYYLLGPNYLDGAGSDNLSPGPVAIGPDGSIYFALNDYGENPFGTNFGCGAPPCQTVVGRFNPTTSEIDTVSLPSVPGVTELYFTSDGALWLSSGDEFWGGPLPGLRIPPGEFTGSAVQQMPSSFGNPFGFTQDSSGNLWITTCISGNSGCEPTVLIVPVSGPYNAPTTISLPSCGSAAGTVGDIAYLGGTFYVLGGNTVWQIAPGSETASCLPNIPPNFGSSPYFALVNSSLVFGSLPFEGNGFYSITNGVVTADTTVQGNPDAVSAYGGLVYYINNSGGDPYSETAGLLGSYSPATEFWNLFPTTLTPFGSPGVAADAGGAWFTTTAIGACGGNCLAQTVYLNEWGAFPNQNLGQLAVGNTLSFGVVTNPEGYAPNNAHGGVFFRGGTSNSIACSVAQITDLTFTVTGLAVGPCPLTITDSTGRTQSLIVEIIPVGSSPSPTPSGALRRPRVQGAPPNPHH